MTVAVVTGGSRGIGRATALEAAHRGYDVLVACGRDRDRAEDVAREVEIVGRRSGACAVDLTTRRGLDELVEAARLLGPVALLVNNAGITNSSSLEDLDEQRWQQALSLNLTAPVWLTKELAPDLSANHGAVINVGSTGGITGSVHSLPYSASKAGLIGATKTLARMLAPTVRVNLVAPGITATDLLDGINDAQREAILSGQVLPRLAHPTEIARVILDVSQWEFATGQTFVVDGGRVM